MIPGLQQGDIVKARYLKESKTEGQAICRLTNGSIKGLIVFVSGLQENQKTSKEFEIQITGSANNCAFAKPHIR